MRMKPWLFTVITAVTIGVSVSPLVTWSQDMRSLQEYWQSLFSRSNNGKTKPVTQRAAAVSGSTWECGVPAEVELNAWMSITPNSAVHLRSNQTNRNLMLFSEEMEFEARHSEYINPLAGLQFTGGGRAVHRFRYFDSLHSGYRSSRLRDLFAEPLPYYPTELDDWVSITPKSTVHLRSNQTNRNLMLFSEEMEFEARHSEYINPLAGLQFTGGSRAVNGFGELMPADYERKCDTSDEFNARIDFAGSNAAYFDIDQRTTYGELAAAAAVTTKTIHGADYLPSQPIVVGWVAKFNHPIGKRYFFVFLPNQP